MADNAQDIPARMEQSERRKALAEVIGKLEPKQRAVIIATGLQGKSFRELSALWHAPLGTLLSRKSRAIKAMRTMLNDLDIKTMTRGGNDMTWKEMWREVPKPLQIIVYTI